MNFYGCAVVGLIEIESEVSPQALAGRRAPAARRPSARLAAVGPTSPIPHVVRADLARLRRQLNCELAVFRQLIHSGQQVC